jgi:hypothetical protein
VRLGSDAARGRGPRCRRAAGAEWPAKQSAGVRKKGKKMMGGPRVSERKEREGLLLAWAGASGRPRRERKSGEARAHAGQARPSAEGEDGLRGSRSRPKERKEAGQAGLGSNFALPFSSLFFSNPFELQSI